MAQNPPTGVVCSASMGEACCCLVSLIQLPVTAIVRTLTEGRTEDRSRTVDLDEAPSGSVVRARVTRHDDASSDPTVTLRICAGRGEPEVPAAAMPKKRKSAAAAAAAMPPAEEEEVVIASSAKRKRASTPRQGKRKRSVRVKAADPDDAETATEQDAAVSMPQAAPGSGGRGSGKKRSSRKKEKPAAVGAAESSVDFSKASAAHLGLDIVGEDDLRRRAEPSPQPPAAAAATPAAATEPAAPRTSDERSWLELAPERVVRLGHDGRTGVRALLRLLDGECAVIEGFYRLKVLRGSVRIGGYSLTAGDDWQPVQATGANVHYLQAMDGSDGGAKRVGVGAEAAAVTGLWKLKPKQMGAVVALESLQADSDGEGSDDAKEPLAVLPSAEGRIAAELGLGLELCRLAPPPPEQTPGSPAPAADGGGGGGAQGIGGKPSTTRPSIAPPEWEHAIRNVSRMHGLALGSSNTNAAAPITLTVGPKNSGKSTICQLLLNSLLEQRSGSGTYNGGTGERGGGMVAYLDLDPGQCEFTAPGMISLLVILDRNVYGGGAGAAAGEPLPAALQHLDEYLPRGPVLGASHAHLRHATIRSCFVGSPSVDSDPRGYQDAVMSLIGSYQQLCAAVSPMCLPLVVNTMGWIRGLGLELLTQTAHALRPTFMIGLASPQQQQNAQQHQQHQQQAGTPRKASDPGSDTGAESEIDDDGVSPRANSPAASNSSGFISLASAPVTPAVTPTATATVTPAVTPAASAAGAGSGNRLGGGQGMNQNGMSADERDIIALKGLAKKIKASFLPLPSGKEPAMEGAGAKKAVKTGRVLTAVELRTLGLLSYFNTPSTCSRYPTHTGDRIQNGHSLAQWVQPMGSIQRPLLNQIPYAIRWANVRIGFSHDQPPNSQALVALNGSLVGLVIDQTQYMPGNAGGNVDPLVLQAAQAAQANGLPGILAAPPPPSSANGDSSHCVGLGIVSRIDPTTKQIFVITPTPPAAVRLHTYLLAPCSLLSADRSAADLHLLCPCI